MLYHLGAALPIKSNKARSMHFKTIIPFWLYSAPIFTFAQIVKELTTLSLLVVLLIQTIVSISFYLPPGHSIFTSRDPCRGHPYTLPTCTFDLFKNSFINRFLFSFI